MRKLKKALSVLTVSALIMTTVLGHRISVLAEETADAQAVVEEDTQETAEEETENSADAESREGSGEDASEDGTQEETENPDNGQYETEIPDEKTPDAEQKESGEESEESSDQGKETENSEAIDPEEGEAEEKTEEEKTEEGEEEKTEEGEEEKTEEGEEEKTEEGEEEKTEEAPEIIKGVRLALNEYSEEELAVLPLSVLLSHLQDGDGNFVEISQDAETVWINVKDDAGTVLLEGKYVRNSGETLDLSQFVNVDGYIMEVTVGSGEKQASGNKQYIAEMNLEAKLTSLLPLEEVYASIVLNGYGEDELKSMPLSVVLNNLQDSQGNKIQLPEGATTVWSYYKDENGNVLRDEYHTIAEDALVDLSSYMNHPSYTMELIVGSGEQLDPGNVRYIVTVYVSNEVEDFISFQLYVQGADGVRAQVKPIQAWSNVSTDNPGAVSSVDVTTFVVPPSQEGDRYFLGISSSAAGRPLWNVDVYSYAGYQDFQSGDTNAPTITDQILNPNMDNMNAGYEGNFESDGTFHSEENLFALVYKNPQTGAVYGTRWVGFVLMEDAYTVDGDLLVYENGQMVSVAEEKQVASGTDGSLELGTGKFSGGTSFNFKVKDQYFADNDYYFAISIRSVVSGEDIPVVKAVEGNYDSLSAAEGRENIQDLLIPSDRSGEFGYKSLYYNADVSFTLFLEGGSIYHVTANDYGSNRKSNTTEAPFVDCKDPWFAVTGARQDGRELDIYAVENDGTNNLDTLYGYGYLTVFVNEDVDLSNIQPEYWVPNEETSRLYFSENGSQGRPVYNGQTTVDFSQGPVQFILVVEQDGITYRKNYIISFVKKTTGSKLFVYGPDTREIFLDEYFEYKHDILIANVGDAPLTGLRVELDATNCKLDDYWNLNNDSYNVLQPFTSTQPQTERGELANLAKITLRPDTSDGKDDTIEGTLTVYADNQDPVVIHLTGLARNPKITTETLDNGVKYVPYSCIIATNNMHNWMKAEYELDGSLPDGMEWIPESGEICGVPTVTGEFPLRITAKFTSDNYDFTPSTVDLTLTILDNTDANVYFASDPGYVILDPIGEEQGEMDFIVTEIKDDEFRSSGEFGEFQALWLNGVMLEKGVDYSAESGSTRIILFSQTFEGKADRSGRNTIAAEFRVGGERTNELKRTAQNFRLDLQASPIQTPEATPTPAPTSVPEATPTPQATITPEPSVTVQPTQSPAATPVPTVEITYVNCAINLVDGDGNPLTTRNLEMHSDPVTSTTDVNGLAGFGHVEFGNHTVYLKGETGDVQATKAFILQKGEKLSCVDDIITAPAGSALTIEMKYENRNLSIIGVREGIQSRKAPSTGDESRLGLWFFLLAVSLGTILNAGIRKARH